MIYHILSLLQSAWHQRALYMCMWPSTASSVIMVVEFLCCFRDTSVFILLHLWNSVIHSNLTGVFSSLEVLKIMVCLVFDGWNAIFLKFLTIPGKTCIHERRQHGRWPTDPSSSKEWMWNWGRAQMLPLYMHSDFFLWNVSRLGTPSGFPGAKPGVDPSRHLQVRDSPRFSPPPPGPSHPSVSEMVVHWLASQTGQNEDHC